MFAGKKSAQIREILISESAWEEMTCLFAPSLENFASLIIQKKDKRTGGASFIEFATSLAYKHRLKLPNGIEAYFAKKHPKVYEDFDLPF